MATNEHEVPDGLFHSTYGTLSRAYQRILGMDDPLTPVDVQRLVLDIEYLSDELRKTRKGLDETIQYAAHVLEVQMLKSKAKEQVRKATLDERARCARTVCPKCAEGDRPIKNPGGTYVHGAWRCAANNIWQGTYMINLGHGGDLTELA